LNIEKLAKPRELCVSVIPAKSFDVLATLSSPKGPESSIWNVFRVFWTPLTLSRRKPGIGVTAEGPIQSSTNGKRSIARSSLCTGTDMK
jgi:hypothetical protein